MESMMTAAFEPVEGEPVIERGPCKLTPWTSSLKGWAVAEFSGPLSFLAKAYVFAAPKGY
jgi:hypothetical protein